MEVEMEQLLEKVWGNAKRKKNEKEEKNHEGKEKNDKWKENNEDGEKNKKLKKKIISKTKKKKKRMRSLLWNLQEHRYLNK